MEPNDSVVNESVGFLDLREEEIDEGRGRAGVWELRESKKEAACD